MLTTKRINLGISVFSKILRFFLIFYTAFILAKCVWWVLSPSENSSFIEWADLDKHDKATNYINNRYPFGIITVVKAKEPPKPKVADELKLTGIYLNTDKDSYAFVEYHSKPLVVGIGDKIEGSNAIVTKIDPDNITIADDENKATINLSAGSSASNTPAAGTNPQYNNSMFNRNNQQNMGNQPTNNFNNPQQQSNTPSADDYRQNRRKVMDDFVKSNQLDKDRPESVGNLNRN